MLVQDTASAYYLKGNVDEVAVYNSALSASRIQAHYSSANGN